MPNFNKMVYLKYHLNNQKRKIRTFRKPYLVIYNLVQQYKGKLKQ